MNFKFHTSGIITQEFLKRGISNFLDAMQYVKHLPYGRNSNRENFLLVLQENKGTCSSKHALLQELAIENEFLEVKLMMGLFEMNGTSYPKIQKTLEANGLNYIPEAHNYLKIKGEIYDCTSSTSHSKDFSPYLIQEIEIQPSDVTERKIQIHQEFLKSWCSKKGFDFVQIWKIREQCIQDLSV